MGIIFYLSELVCTRWVTDSYIHTAVRSPTCDSVKHKILRRPSAHCELGFPHLALDEVAETAKPRLSPCRTAHGWCWGSRFSGTVTPRSWRAGWVMGRPVVDKLFSFFISMLVGPKRFSKVTHLKHKHAAFCSMCFYPHPTPLFHQYLYAVVSVSPTVSLGSRSCWTSVT